MALRIFLASWAVCMFLFCIKGTCAGERDFNSEKGVKKEGGRRTNAADDAFDKAFNAGAGDASAVSPSAAGIGAKTVGKAFDSPPDLCVILVDDPGYADFTGRSQVQLGNTETLFDVRQRDSGQILTALSSRSIVCTRAYASFCYCAPSRMGLLSGRYQQRDGFYYNPEEGSATSPDDRGLSPSAVLFPSLLQQAGYETACIGKWHLGAEEAHHPLYFGFDRVVGFMYGSRPYHPTPLALLQKFNPPPQPGSRMLNSRRLENNGGFIKESSFDFVTDELTRAAVIWWRVTTGPKFLFMSYSAPHTPLDYLQPDYDRQSHLTGKRRAYAALCANLDRNIGRLLETIGPNTVVIFAGDNGGEFRNGGAVNAPLRGYKGMYFEGGVRVPFVMRAPWLRPGYYDKPVSLLDIAPTLLTIAGADIPDNLDGVDLQPYFNESADGVPHERLYWKSPKARQGVWRDAAMLEGNWKYIRNYGGAEHLYDHETDPDESLNLAMRAEHQQKVSELRETLRLWEATLPPPRWGANLYGDLGAAAPSIHEQTQLGISREDDGED